MSKPLRIAFDVGGVISKRPEVFIPLMIALNKVGIEVYIVSDMPHEALFNMLIMNGLQLPPERVISADYQRDAELCKARVCEKLYIDILIDDFVGYVADGHHIRLLMMPDSSKPYYSPEWKTDGKEGDFGRRTPKDG